MSFDELLAAESGPSEISDEVWERADSAIDAIRGRFGTAAIGPARILSPGGIRTKETGQGAWGPDIAE
ncbi:MAG: hypothetical protein R2706_18155 [Acidimicrobiales bacterium]